jgi:hypothetical protein
MPPPPPYVEEEMLEATTGQVPQAHIPGSMRHRLDTRFRLELGDQLCALLVEVGVHPVMMQDIREYPMLLDIWREISCDMMPLMHYIVRSTRILAERRFFDDTHSSSNTRSSSTPSTGEGGYDSSPRPPLPSHHPHEKATPIPPPCDLPLPPDHPSSSTIDQASTTIVDMIITSAGPYML